MILFIHRSSTEAELSKHQYVTHAELMTILKRRKQEMKGRKS